MDTETLNRASAHRRHAYRHHRRSWLGSWLKRIRTSRTAKRKFINFMVLVAVVLAAFVIGFYYIGPSFTSG